MGHCVYLLECSDDRGSFYIGYTTDLTRRLAEHNAGNGAKYTRGRTPVTVRYVEYWPSKSAAMSREWELKQRSRAGKERLVPDSEQRVAVVFDPGD
ncbi:MAG: putative endonuclease containing a URI domain protein [halophilic archaeon J07HX64]|jgi:Predicted endonuclease containing a URI domain|nr:MAG: putative endonuclease containing a URI domain protein [halophilic archaeon J07HX64]